jgi:hypothetical protein
VPAEFDWRDNGGDFVTGVRDQGGCGSCWAFAATAVLESNVLMARNTPGVDLDLSEETLVGCQGPTYDGRMPNSCAGGSLLDAARFIKQKGLPREKCYPYDESNGICSSACAGWKANAFRIDSFIDLYMTAAGSRVDLIKQHVLTYGPTAVAMTVYQDFYYYDSGVYNHAWGGSQGGHAVVVVGWSDPGQYFIAKNSWGTDWGSGESEKGFFRIAYGETTTGVGFGYWISAFGNAYQNGVLPDLQCTGFAAPDTLVESGSPFSVEGTIRNAGTADAGASTAKLWLAKDADGVVGNDWPAGEVAVPALAVGEEALVSWPIAALPSFGAVPRGIRPVAIVDAGKEVIERNEANKFASADPLFTVEPPVWVRVASPNRRVTWRRGAEVSIAWDQKGCTTVDIELRRRTSGGWRTRAVASGVDATASPYLWDVPRKIPASSRYKVRVLCADEPAAVDLSNRYFTVR